MPPKKHLPAPIDRPLSRAYLREFTGWSTAYPPGISDPTSLRVMENMQINRDGSIRVRPGLRYLSYQTLTGGGAQAGTGITNAPVGAHEPFFLNDGSKAYLFAVRENDGSIGFRVFANTGGGLLVQTLTAVGFTVGPGLNFTSGTTYVKYLQIDNKIFALSNGGETMRLFTVGSVKTAKALNAIDRPAWSVADKLTVVHPDAAWVTAASPTSARTNRILNPNMELISSWPAAANTAVSKVTTNNPGGASGGTLQVSSLPERTNLATNPLRNASVGGLGGWGPGSGSPTLTTNIAWVQISVPSGTAGRVAHMDTSGRLTAGIAGGTAYRVAYDVDLLPANISGLLCKVRFYTSAGVQIGGDLDTSFGKPANGTRVVASVTAPAGAGQMSLHLQCTVSNTAAASYLLKDVTVAVAGEPTTGLDGASGTNYFWTGAAYNSTSVYHPPKDVQVQTTVTGLSRTDWVASLYATAGSVARDVTLKMQWLNASDAVLGTSAGTAATEPAAGTWTRLVNTALAPVGTVKAAVQVSIPQVPRGEVHYLDSALFEEGTSANTYFDGSTADTGTLLRDWTGAANASTSTESILSIGGSIPPAETKTASTLISSTAADNDYNFAFFYTFNNEIGESAPSQLTVVRVQRGWQAWRWETPNAAGEPSGTGTGDPAQAADQLVAYMPQAVFDAAVAQGAIGWNLYMVTWSDQDPVPVTALRVATRALAPGMPYSANAWLRATPQMADAGDESASLPKLSVRRNYSDPSRGGQGIVAADRMVVVNDPVAQGVIRWTSNQQGSYTDFSAARGGGYKTLTSGNLFVPACVKLWQNPSSADTLTVLCMGVDGYSTGYYMAPAQVASQSEAVNVMGFEETTATPGTTSPYGVEVMNNALYHPLDDQLMKSTATNYNINHKPMTDLIQNMWRGLQFKHHIVSAQYDSRIYYLVYNPYGAQLEADCWGNEVWVFDSASTAGTWSRWLTQGKSLRKIEQGGAIVMSLVRPDGIFYFDETYDVDDVVAADHTLSQRNIAWKLETNTQGANRAHDAWAHVQQLAIVLGQFQGQLRYGLRARDIHGRVIDLNKIVRDTNDPATGVTPMFDLEDNLRVALDLREWFFYAESVEEDGVTQKGVGQVDLVQYRYTPSTVNTGYEFGSVETFEYGRAAQPLDNRTTDNGVPMPYVDTGRP